MVATPASYPGQHPGEGSSPDAPELADLRRYGRRLVRRFVAQARADEQPTFAGLVTEHLGVPTHDLPLIEERWAPYEHVNVQAALDAWLAEPGRSAEVVGMTNYRHRGPFGLGDLIRPDLSEYGGHHGPRPGNLSRVGLPVGPDGEKLQCLRAAVLLITEEGGDRIALLYRGSDRESDMYGVTVEAIASRPGLAEQATARLRELADEHNVFRGQVLSFGHDMFGERGSVLRFHKRRPMSKSDLILPEATFADLRRQVIGVALNRARLRASGQHLKRGLLLHGPPGVGKTHTVRYLIGELDDTTVVELTGDTLPAIKEACSIARSLEPAMIVVEDVDLIAEQRDRYGGESPLLFTLLNEMDGLAEDADVVFLLTTNRADLLEPALAARPGRVDQAVHIDLPDRDARLRLVRLYCRRLDLDTSRLDDVLDRTEGVTASFLKELVRRSAVVAGDREERRGATGALRVTAEDLDHALADLLDTRNQMTRAVLGFRTDEPG
jgi:ATPase family associated with various cellular activities (AAA)